MDKDKIVTKIAELLDGDKTLATSLLDIIDANALSLDVLHLCGSLDYIKSNKDLHEVIRKITSHECIDLPFVKEYNPLAYNLMDTAKLSSLTSQLAVGVPRSR